MPRFVFNELCIENIHLSEFGDVVDGGRNIDRLDMQATPTSMGHISFKNTFVDVYDVTVLEKDGATISVTGVPFKFGLYDINMYAIHTLECAAIIPVGIARELAFVKPHHVASVTTNRYRSTPLKFATRKANSGMTTDPGNFPTCTAKVDTGKMDVGVEDTKAGKNARIINRGGPQWGSDSTGVNDRHGAGGLMDAGGQPNSIVDEGRVRFCYGLSNGLKGGRPRRSISPRRCGRIDIEIIGRLRSQG